MGHLVGLSIAPLRLHLLTNSSFRTPEYKGSLFRGGFGQFFRDLVCVTRAPVCAGCQKLETCPYSLVFETPVIPDKFTVLRKYPSAPHPFVLTPPLDPRTSLPAGAQLTLELTLIGRGIGYLPHFITVFDAMGKSGRYGGAFHLPSVVSALDGEIPVYDGASRRFLADPPLWLPPSETPPVARIRLDFLTPLRIRTEGRYNASPDFVALTQALLRRIHLLTAIYGDGNGDAAWMHPLLAAADRATTTQSNFHLYQWTRQSGRQHRPIAMDGILGSLESTGDLRSLAPYYQAGEWLHMGSGTSMGMGRFHLTCGAQS
jgi:hypothetical protein